MAILSHFILILAFFMSLFFSAFSVYSLWRNIDENYSEVIQKVILCCVAICYIILSIVFLKRDFSFVIVENYTDTYLPWYYALTAVWAGQEGSLLLWLLFVAISGVIFSRKQVFKTLPNNTRNIFWSLFFAVEALFLLLLITYANPFLVNSIPPKQGMGLNPLLMHPGMIFHPPTLFAGYAGFTVPALLLISIKVTGFNFEIIDDVKRWSLISWLFLTIGIVLGMWWSYYELGWGGYWAWDPVENASLIPWLCSSAFIHIFIVAKKEKALERSSTFVLGLTLISCFIATFLTRSGVVDSLHAFGKSSIGKPLIIFIIEAIILFSFITLYYPTTYNKPLSGIFSKNGLLILTSWIFLGLCVVILMGTMFPLISNLMLNESKGVGQEFYNRVFLPISSFLIFILCICPWFKWKTEAIKKQGIFFIVIFLCLSTLIFAFITNNMLVLLSISSSVTGIMSILYFIIANRYYTKIKYIGKWGVHIGIVIIALSIAISSGFKDNGDYIIAKGQTIDFNGYKIVYNKLERKEYEHKSVESYIFSVYKNNTLVGKLMPERIHYFIQNNLFSKVSVLKCFFDEIYISVHQSTNDGVLKIEIQRNPMVHWIWFGTVLLCISGLISLLKNRLRIE